MNSRLLVSLLVLLAVPLFSVVWAFRQPRPRAVQVGMAVALLAYLWLLDAYGREVLWSVELLALLPLYAAPVPLALLLGGLTQARRAHRPVAYLAWVGLAVMGVAGLLLLPIAWLPVGLLDSVGQTLTLVIEQLVTFGMNLFAW